MIQNLAATEQVFTSNVFLVTGERTVLVDVGNDFDVVAATEEHVEDVDAVVLTHTHPDHVGELAAVVEAFDIEVWGYDADFDGVDHELDDGDTVAIGDSDYEVLHTPGHKNDHVCLYTPTERVLFAGDLIFANGGFGRTDLEEGDRQLLIESIERVHERVGENLVEMHTGHGPSITTDPYTDVELALRAAKMGA